MVFNSVNIYEVTNLNKMINKSVKKKQLGKIEKD